VIARDANEAHVWAKSEAGEQVLAELHAEARVQLRNQRSENAVGGNAVVLEKNLQACASRESLRVAEVRGTGVLGQRWNSVQNRVRERECAVLDVEVTSENGVERINLATGAQS